MKEGEHDEEGRSGIGFSSANNEVHKDFNLFSSFEDVSETHCALNLIFSNRVKNHC